MYIPGRLRTASRPSSTVMDPAPYSCLFSATLGHFLARGREAPHGVGGRTAGSRRARETTDESREKERTTGETVRAGRRGRPADRDRLRKPRSVTAARVPLSSTSVFPVTVDSTPPTRVREGPAPRPGA